MSTRTLHHVTNKSPIGYRECIDLEREAAWSNTPSQSMVMTYLPWSQQEPLIEAMPGIPLCRRPMLVFRGQKPM